MNEEMQTQAARCYSHLSHQGNFRRQVTTSVDKAVRISHPNIAPGECKPAQPSRAMWPKASKALKAHKPLSQQFHPGKVVHRTHRQR